MNRTKTDNIRHILLVEDESIIAMHEKHILEKNGFQVQTAISGERALEIVREDSHFDLILMDINLGKGIDGTEAAEIILRTHDLPLIFLSSHTEHEVVEKTEGITSYGYIVKNSGETVLLASIKMAFRLFKAKIQEKEKERALRESERMLNTLISNLPGFVYRCRNDKDWTMEYISDGCKSTTGYTSEEFLFNKRIAFNDIIHPDYQLSIWQKWQNILLQNTVFEDEYPIVTASGELRWVWERGRGIYSSDGRLLHLEGFIQDITERKRTESGR